MREFDKESAEKAHNSSHWKWRKGVVTAAGWRVVEVQETCDIVQLRCDGYKDVYLTAADVVGVCGLPRLEDDATKGCVLALIREARGNPGIGCFMWADEEWVVIAPQKQPGQENLPPRVCVCGITFLSVWERPRLKHSQTRWIWKVDAP